MQRRSTRLVRGTLLAALAACSLGVTACGDDGLSREEIAQRVDAESGSTLGQDGLTLEQRQAAADADARAAERAREREEEIQQREADAAEQRRREEAAAAQRRREREARADAAAATFRDQVAAACDAGASQIDGIVDDALAIANADDPAASADEAAAYATGVLLLTESLRGVDPPAGFRGSYADWLEAIDELGATVAEIPAAADDPQELERLRSRTRELAGQVSSGSSALGVACDVGAG